MSSPRTVGVLLFPAFEPLDVFGPVEAFAIAERDGAPAFAVVTIAERLEPVPMRGGPRLVPDHTLDTAPALDVLVVPGGPGTRSEVANEAVRAFLRDRARRVEVLASVCTGAALLGAAGLLDGLSATTNRRSFDWVVSVSSPAVRWDRESRFVDAGRVVTSAGVSAGTDMALHLVSRLAGDDVARAAAQRMEYATSPAGGPGAPPRGRRA
jgi:transcriptional regulator GlxA family with amidase domain